MGRPRTIPFPDDAAAIVKLPAAQCEAGLYRALEQYAYQNNQSLSGAIVHLVEMATRYKKHKQDAKRSTTVRKGKS